MEYDDDNDDGRPSKTSDEKYHGMEVLDIVGPVLMINFHDMMGVKNLG